MKKFLVITSVASMVDQFLMPNIQMLKDMNYDVHVACNFEKGSTCSNERIQELKQKLGELKIKYFQIDFARNVLDFQGNLQAYRQVVSLIKENQYDLVHCHSPIGGLVTRLACIKARKNGTKVIYTAHGFHFYKGAPLLNWLIYYPVEKLCSYFTDTLITINQEDFALAKKKMKAKKVEYVPGVGIDLSRFQNVQVDRSAKRKEIGVPEDATLILSVGELNENKNHEVIIRAISQLNNPNVHYAIAGKGDKESYLSELAGALGVAEQVHLLGYRTDVAELYKTADIYTLPSIREGLNVSLMESMASGLPCAVGNIRGNTDLIDENGGVLFDPHSVDDCKDALNSLLKSDFTKMGEYNAEKIKSFSVEMVNEIMFEIY
ncbi:MAG: glycosyltransferase family 4 protein [Ruminococcaceae bacterium]|nr:glycosyltransferase family 4 protein [Oscillospiraceae bacterium]